MKLTHLLLIEFWQCANNTPWGKGPSFQFMVLETDTTSRYMRYYPYHIWWTRFTNNQTEVIELQYMKLGGKHYRRTGDSYTALGCGISWIWPQDKNRWIWMFCPPEQTSTELTDNPLRKSISSVPILCIQSMHTPSNSSKESKYHHLKMGKGPR